MSANPEKMAFDAVLDAWMNADKHPKLVNAIAKKIRAAVEAERKRCADWHAKKAEELEHAAAIAKSMIGDPTWDDGTRGQFYANQAEDAECDAEMHREFARAILAPPDEEKE